MHMSLRQRHWWLIGFTGAICLIVILYLRYGPYSESLIEARKHALEIAGVDDLPEIEKRFLSSPALTDCLWLVDKTGNVQKDYLKAIKYGNECLSLPGSDESGWLINFWLASLYNKANDPANAKEHLVVALRTDTRQLIKNGGWIESEGLGSLYAEITP